MSSKASNFKTIALGGMIFLVPFVVVVLIGGKALVMMRSVAAPVAAALGLKQIGSGGLFEFLIINAIAIALLAGLCYLAGLAAMRGRGGRLQRAFDEKLLELFPRYTFIKSMAESFGTEASYNSLKTVLVHFDDQSQIAFETERTAEWVAVYLPGSPDPWGGAVSLVKPERVQPLDVDFNDAVKHLRLIGRGATALL